MSSPIGIIRMIRRKVVSHYRSMVVTKVVSKLVYDKNTTKPMKEPSEGELLADTG